MNEILENLKIFIQILGILGVVIEITPIKISPLKWIGCRLNKSTNDRLDELEKRLDKLEDKSLKQDLKETRSIILDFANSIRNNRRHTVEEYDHIIEMIDEYHEKCRKYKIENGVIDVQARFIVDTYMRLSRNAAKNGVFEEKIKSGDLL